MKPILSNELDTQKTLQTTTAYFETKLHPEKDKAHSNSQVVIKTSKLIVSKELETEWAHQSEP